MGVLQTLRSVIRLRRPEFDSVKRRLSRAAGIEDLRRIARRRLPRGVFDYIDGAAEAEVTAKRNIEAFSRIEFRPRVLRNMGTIDITSKILGSAVAMPLVLAPTGFTRIACSDGELAVAREADQIGIPYTLSSLSTRSIEEVRAVSQGELWFQVYVWRDRGLLREMLDRARAAHYSAIVITVDTSVLGRRERDVRRGFTLPPKIGLGTLLDGIAHPAWTKDFLTSEPIRFANVAGKSVGDGTDAVSLADFINTQFDPSLNWSDIAWFREQWPRPIVLKGIQTVDDARIAAAEGIDAVALSNHGGRQLDGSPPPVELIAPVVEAVGDDLEVFCDGGIRRGSDIVKSLALGASACMVGRPYLYGLGAGGQQGVKQALELLREGMRRTMALTGCTSITDLNPETVQWRSDA